jgi:Glyoxalase-like domain
LLKIDHLLLACHNVFLTSRQLRDETGLATYEGGYLEEHGLAQRIVPLGNSQFIEIESVVDVDHAMSAPRPIARHILETTRESPVLLSSYLLTDDLDAHAARCGVPARTPTILRPDGSTAVVRVAPRVDETLAERLPIWYDGDRDRVHAGDVPVDHKLQPNGIAWLELGGPADRIREWVGPEIESLPIRLAGGEPGIRAVGIAMIDGSELVIRPTNGQLSAAA